MLEKQDEIEELGAAVVLVAYDETSLLQAKMLRDLPQPWPLLLDPDKRTYAAWGMGRTGFLRTMLSPSMNWRYLRLLMKGERFLGLAPDMFQLGGDFVLDADGRIATAHRMKNSGDRVAVPVLMDALRTVAEEGGSPNASPHNAGT